MDPPAQDLWFWLRRVVQHSAGPLPHYPRIIARVIESIKLKVVFLKLNGSKPGRLLIQHLTFNIRIPTSPV